MHPMDFEEFLWAMEEDKLMDFIRMCFDKIQPVGQPMHRKTMDYFCLYLIIGGMPQAIQEYLDTRSFEDADRVKRQILNLYHKGWRLPLHSALYGALPIKRNDLISYRYIAYMTRCLCLSRFDLEVVLLMIRQKRYFVLHEPRQTGKTSCMLVYATI